MSGKEIKPKVIVLCGSSRFVDLMAVCSWLIEKNENAITMGLHLLPAWYSYKPIPDHLAEHENVADQMDCLHLHKIDLADEVFVVNAGGYIGNSTNNEIKYAEDLGINIRYFTESEYLEKIYEIHEANAKMKKAIPDA